MAPATKRQPEEPAEPAEEPTPQDYTFPVSLNWGGFLFRAMTVRDLLSLRPRIRHFWGGPLPIPGTPDGVEDLQSYEYMIASGMAEMERSTVEAPEGWSWSDVRDPDRIAELWREYQRSRDSFRETLGGF